MAVSNRDRIGRGFEILADGLSRFVNEKMTDAFSGQQENWIQIIESRDAAKNGVTKNYELADPAFQLRIITEEWRTFLVL